ncbi:hypothetical protein KTR10_02440 [Candidatus Kaiserbacteria bacterium]|nr:hypothetical protein [Candidatus Kaiserbacteria bacterium]
MSLNLIDGTDGNDVLRGGNEDDLILGHGGSDLLVGKGGNDVLAGDGIEDTDSDGVIVGSERLRDDNPAAIWGGTGDDWIAGTEGDDTLGGGSGADVIRDHGGDDLVFGGAGDDTIIVVSGDNVVFGGVGNDTIEIFEGENDVYSGAGDDLIGSGFDADTFHFATGHGNDTIEWFDELDTLYLVNTTTDFQSVDDVIAHATNVTDGVLIDTGGGDSILLQDLSVDDLASFSYVF